MGSSQMPLTIHITDHAQKNLHDIRRYGRENHTPATRIAYAKLIEQALNDLADDPKRIGSDFIRHPSDKLRQYPLGLSKKRAGVKIKNPPDAIIYFTVKDEILVVSAITNPVRERHISQLDTNGQ